MPAYRSNDWSGGRNNNHWPSWHSSDNGERWTGHYQRADYAPPPKKAKIEKSEEIRPVESQIGIEEFATLRQILFGEMVVSNDVERWEQQSFEFCETGPVWGLKQRHGGPCGVLAAAQGFILCEVFAELKNDVCARGMGVLGTGNGACVRDLPLVCCSWLRGACPYGGNCKFGHVNTDGAQDAVCQHGARCRHGHSLAQNQSNQKGSGEPSQGGLVLVLAQALTAMLRNAQSEDTSTFRLVKWGPAEDDAAKDLAFRRLHIVSLPNASAVVAWLCSDGGIQLRQPGAVLSFVASLLLTRGLSLVQQDMDDPGQHMITTFGHCSQELMNLCITGKATSNVHDGNITFGEEGEDCISLKGVEQTPTIGYLSAFEALNQLEVGHHYKQPRWPIWVIGGPMHYTICFSPDCSLNHVEMPAKRETDGDDAVKTSVTPSSEDCGVCGHCLSGHEATLSSIKQLQQGVLYHFNGLEQKAAGTGQSIRSPAMRKCYLSANSSGQRLGNVASSDEDPELFQMLLRARWTSVDVTWDGEDRTAPLLN